MYEMIDMQNDELAWNTTSIYTWKSKDMINYMKNNMRNEMAKWYDMKKDRGCIKMIMKIKKC